MLPARKVHKQILDSVDANRVTVISGGTGCGKSSQVPQILLDHFGQSTCILCTQPRRLAVVSVAKRVAAERGVALGEDSVGYAIGQCRVTKSSNRAVQLLFCTAGILLENLRANGSAALQRYKVLIMDECHERSAESDLILACVKRLMLAGQCKDMKIVLMSVTFDQQRYVQYLSQIDPAGYVGSVNIPDFMIGAPMYHAKELYLDNAIQLLSAQDSTPEQSIVRKRYEKLVRECRAEPEEFGTKMQSDLYTLMVDLVLLMHNRKLERDYPILVFLPTYKALEAAYCELIKKLVHGRYPTKRTGCCSLA